MWVFSICRCHMKQIFRPALSRCSRIADGQSYFLFLPSALGRKTSATPKQWDHRTTLCSPQPPRFSFLRSEIALQLYRTRRAKTTLPKNRLLRKNTGLTKLKSLPFHSESIQANKKRDKEREFPSSPISSRDNQPRAAPVRTIPCIIETSQLS